MVTEKQRRPGADNRGGASDRLGSGSGTEVSSPVTVAAMLELAKADPGALGTVLRRVPTDRLHQVGGILTAAGSRAHRELQSGGVWNAEALRLRDPELASTAWRVAAVVTQINAELDQREREAAIGRAAAVYAELLGTAGAS